MVSARFNSMLLGRALHAATSGRRLNRHADKPDVPRPCGHATVCQASQGWYSGAVYSQSKHSAGPLKAPTDTRQRTQEQERRESGSQASTTQTLKHRFEFDQSSQLGHNSSSQLGGSSDRPTSRGVPVAWAFDPRDLELLDPDQQYKRSDRQVHSRSSQFKLFKMHKTYIAVCCVAALMSLAPVTAAMPRLCRWPTRSLTDCCKSVI